jgi:hypothetical protein
MGFIGDALLDGNWIYKLLTHSMPVIAMDCEFNSCPWQDKLDMILM